MKKIDFIKTTLFAYKGIYDETVEENSIKSFQSAISLHYGLFLDVQMTKDGVVVIYSNDDLSDFNVKDALIDTSYEELCNICSNKIITLEEGLKYINNTPVIINIKYDGKTHLINEKIAAILEKNKENFMITSENAINLKWFNNFQPEFIIGEICSKNKCYKHPLKNFFARNTIKTDFKIIDIKKYTIETIKYLKKHNVLIGSIIDSEEDYLTYKDYFDSLINDTKIILPVILNEENNQ